MGSCIKDDYKMYKWTEAINQAADMIKNDTDPLTIVYRLHDIRQNPDGCGVLSGVFQQSYEIKSPPWTILCFRILGIFSVENIARLGVFMFQTSDNSQLCIELLSEV